jgi:hypothetical protein
VIPFGLACRSGRSWGLTPSDPLLLIPSNVHHGRKNQRARESLLPRPHQNSSYYGLKHHKIALHKATQAIILLRDLFYIILTHLRVITTLSALSIALLGGFTSFSAHLLLHLLSITCENQVRTQSSRSRHPSELASNRILVIHKPLSLPLTIGHKGT